MDWITVAYAVGIFAAGYVLRHVQAVQAGTAKSWVDPNNKSTLDDQVREAILKLAASGAVPGLTVAPMPTAPAPAPTLDHPVVTNMQQMIQTLLSMLVQNPPRPPAPPAAAPAV